MTTGSAPAHPHPADTATRRAEVDAEICQWLVEADEERDAILLRAEHDAAEVLRVAENRAAEVLAAAQEEAGEVLARAGADVTRLRAEAASAYLREVADGRALAARLVAEGRERGEQERAAILATLEPVRAELDEARTALLRAVRACDEVRPSVSDAGEPPSLTLVRPTSAERPPAEPTVQRTAEPTAEPAVDRLPRTRAQLLDALPLAAGGFVRRLPRLFVRR